ncbi:hypothetical protein AB0I55_07720 [Actinocatenispora sera]|uniref:hypothetical protein n=1 Tax=Actinocatenispora sera TaxID=390989 RepID=UPI0033E2E96E
MLTRSRKVFRAFLATGITAILTATLVSAVPATASAAPPTEVATIPADPTSATAPDGVVFAGATGLLHHRAGATELFWTDYTTGATRPASTLDDVPVADIHPGGGDHVAVYGTDAGGTVQVGVPGSGALSSYPVPAGYRVMAVGAAGATAVVFKPSSGTTVGSLELLNLASGTTSPVDGLPSTAIVTTYVPPLADGEDHALIRFQLTVGGRRNYLFVDLRTNVGTAVSLSAGTALSLTPSVLAWSNTTTDGHQTVSELTQQQLLAGGAPTPTVTPLPSPPSYDALPDGGSQLVVVTHPDYGHHQSGPVSNYPVGGGAAGALLAEHVTAPIQAADGSVLVAGAATADQSVVHRFAPADDGTLTDHVVLEQAVVQPNNAGIAMAHGNLRHIESNLTAVGGTDFHLYNHGVTPDPNPSGAPFGHLDGGAIPSALQRCATGEPCVRTIDGGPHGLTYVALGAPGYGDIESRYDTAVQSVNEYQSADDVQLMDESPDWLLAQSASTGEQYVVGVAYATYPTVYTSAVTGAALWHDTLYRATAAGTITQYSLSVTGLKAVRTIKTGGSCQADEVQVAQHWLYWSCAGTAGVYDLATNTAFAVPAGQAELGDGYLVLRDSGGLQLVDVHTDSAATPARLATLPATTLSDDRNIDWTVDRYSGDVAYVSADDTVHVLTTGVPGSALTGTATNGYFVRPRAQSGPWKSQATFDRPVTGWRLTLTRQATGKVAYTETGGASRESVTGTWDGRLADGSFAPNGDYEFQWYGTVDGTSAPVPGASGTMQVLCGAEVFRDYYCAGSGGVLRDDKTNFDTGLAFGTGDGKLRTDLATSYWPLGTTSTTYTMLIPFGDLNGDGHDDLLVRNGTGDVGGYLGDGAAGSTGATAST